MRAPILASTNVTNVGHRAVVVLLLLSAHWIVAGPTAAQDLDAEIKAMAEQLVEKHPPYEDHLFKQLSSTTQEAVKLLYSHEVEIGLYRLSINDLKREPSLTHEQLRWLVEIENLFVLAEGQFRAARGVWILSDENVGFPGSQSTFLGSAIRNSGEASRNFDKAKRDLAALRTRVGMQAKPQ